MNNLTGVIPDFLGSLPNLEFLNLNCSGLGGPIPTDLSKQSTLKLVFSQSCAENLPSHGTGEGKSKKIVWAVVIPVVAFCVLMLAGCWLYNKRRKKSNGALPNRLTPGPTPPHLSPALPNPLIPGATSPELSPLECKVFTSTELSKITNNYAKLIGVGGYGKVYDGYLDNGKHVAVKKIYNISAHGLRQFQAEVEVLKTVHHRYLVPFLGYCQDADYLALIYEYMPGGSLEDHLSGKFDHVTLSWNRRLQLACEAAQGLEYLHHGCRKPIVHRDVKASNILLTEKLEARIADFGLSKIFSSHGVLQEPTTVMGTAGYLDPEYHNTGMLTEKSDVYSFGIVLLELITGLPRFIRKTGRVYIVDHVKDSLRNGNLRDIVDKNLAGEFQDSSAWNYIDIATACVTLHSEDRPVMSDVLMQLKQCLEVESSYKASDDRVMRRFEEVGTWSGIPSTSTDGITMGSPAAR